jgi:Raf kinase inhibitor-like YbhB/YbcL family protein
MKLKLALAAALLPSLAAAAPLTVRLQNLTQTGFLPLSAAFCLPQGKPQDQNPGVTWSAGPPGTKSYALIMTDLDVPKNLSLIDQPGITIPATAPRMKIYHWVLIDIPAATTTIAAGQDSSAFLPGGKPPGPGPIGTRGTNDYWPYFNKRPGAPAAMKGPYAGYDGPCPPTNDLKTHDYEFQVFALNVAKLPLTGKFFAPAVLKAIHGHVLAEGETSAKFSYNGS